MSEIYLNLPWVPAYGSYYKQTLRSKYITDRGRGYREAVAIESAAQNALNLRIESNIEFSVIMYPPDKRIRDFDNHLKALQDALTHCGVWVDDSAVDQMHVYRGVVVKNGKILIKIAQGSMLLPLLPVYSDIWDLIIEN